MRIAYLDTFSGISGDMTVGALLDLGLPIERVRDAVSDARAATAWRCGRSGRSARGIAATKFHVRVHGQHPDRRTRRVTARPPRPSALRAIRDLIAAQRARAAGARARARDLRASRRGRSRGARRRRRIASSSTRWARSMRSSTWWAPRSGSRTSASTRIHVAPLPIGRGLVAAAHGPLPVPGPAVPRAAARLAGAAGRR